MCGPFRWVIKWAPLWCAHQHPHVQGVHWIIFVYQSQSPPSGVFKDFHAHLIVHTHKYMRNSTKCFFQKRVFQPLMEPPMNKSWGGELFSIFKGNNWLPSPTFSLLSKWRLRVFSYTLHMTCTSKQTSHHDFQNRMGLMVITNNQVPWWLQTLQFISGPFLCLVLSFFLTY